MSLYALVVVPPEWKFGMPLPVSQTTHDLWHGKLEAGTRIVFYDPAAKAIVGEGEALGVFVRPQEWHTSNDGDLPPWMSYADYALPVKTLYQREAESLIPLEEVRQSLNDNNFPQGIGELRELAGTTYQLLTQNFP
jgi:hypothetical protein